MRSAPGTIGCTKKENRLRRHEWRDLVVHLADLIQKKLWVTYITTSKQRVRSAMIGEQVPFRCDPLQNIRMGLRHLPDNEEGGPYLLGPQHVEDCRGPEVGSVIEGERDDMGAPQSGIVNVPGLKVGEPVLGSHMATLCLRKPGDD